MSELIRSIEKSVAYLKERYPKDLPLLVSLEGKLERLYAQRDDQEQKSPRQEDDNG